MSRTYRRLKGYIPEYVFEASRPRPIHERYWRRGLLEKNDYAYPGKKLDQQIACWFGDFGYRWNNHSGKDTCKWERIHTQRQHRTQAKEEIVNYFKNPEYEVIISRKKLLPWD